MQLGGIKGLTIRAANCAWPDELLGEAARLQEADVYQRMLGSDWQSVLAGRQWAPDRAASQWGVTTRSWCRGGVWQGNHSKTADNIELALLAAQGVLASAAIAAADIDCIVVATNTPQTISAGIAAKLACALGSHGAAFDIRAGGSGGLAALCQAAAWHQAGCRRSLVIACEVSSLFLGPHDLANALLFGDGAVALVLESSSGAETEQTQDLGLIAARFGNLDWQGRAFTIPGKLPPPQLPVAEDYCFQAPDRDYQHCLAQAWQTAGDALQRLIDQCDMTPDVLLPYAITQPQVQKLAERFSLPCDDSLHILREQGCVGCVSPLAALAHYWRQQREQQAGSRLVASIAVGGGISWSCLLWRF